MTLPPPTINLSAVCKQVVETAEGPECGKVSELEGGWGGGAYVLTGSVGVRSNRGRRRRKEKG